VTVFVAALRQALRKRLDRPRVPLLAHATMLEDPESKFARWSFSFDPVANERAPGLLVKQTNAMGRRPVVIALHGTGGNGRPPIRFNRTIRDAASVHFSSSGVP